MDDENPIFRRSEDRGPTPPSNYSATPAPNSRPSPKIQKIIGELGLRYRPSATADLEAHAATLALLCRDLADIPPHLLEQAARQWAVSSPYLPKASDLASLSQKLATAGAPKVPDGDVWARRVKEGNRMLIDAKMQNRAHWETNNSGCAIVAGPMSREAFDLAMTVDPAIFTHLRRQAA